LRRKGQRTKFARIMASERTIRPYAWLSVSASLLLIVAASTHARAQTDQLGEEERLEREFTNPLTTLPQLLVRDSYSPATYGRCNLLACPRNAETNQIIIRPLFPRIPSNTLLPFIQLVRPTFSVLTVPSSRGGVRTEFGDLPLLILQFSLGRTAKDRGTDRSRPIAGLPNRYVQKRRPGRMASGARAGRSLPGNSWLAGRLRRAEPDFFRIHLAQASSPEHVDRSARLGAPPVGKVVPTIR
jgi:hypothetical protein